MAEIAAYDTVFLRHTRGATAMIPYETLLKILGKNQGYTEILIKPNKEITTEGLRSELETMLSCEEYQIKEVVNEAQIKADAKQKSMPFFLISFFAMTMSVFIIYSSYKVIIMDRLPIIGTFRSIGAEQKVVKRILLLESAFYGVLGGILGIPLGITVLKLILHGMGKTLSQSIDIPVVISPLSILVSFFTAVVVSMLSAWIPVLSASRLPIKEVVLGSVEKRHRSKKLVLAEGIVFMVSSILIPKVVPADMLYLAGGLSLLGLILAAIILIPYATDLIAIGLEYLYGVMFGNEGKIAARNIRNNKNITQSITLLFISISSIIAISVVGDFVTSYVTDVFKGAELHGFADGHIDEEFLEQVKLMEGIEKVLPLRVVKNQMTINGIQINRLEATDLIEWYGPMFAINYTDKDMEEKITNQLFQNNVVMLSENIMSKLDIKVGETVSLSNGTNQVEYQVVSGFKSRANDVEVVLSSTCLERDFGVNEYDFLAYTAKNPDGIMIQIRELFGEMQNWSRTIEEFNSDAISTVGAFLQPMHSMTYFILILAIVGIMNNLLINYMQRLKSIAMYKSLGLSEKQNLKITLLEGLATGIIGALVAICISYMEIQTIFIVVAPKVAMIPELDISVFWVAGTMGIVVTLVGLIVPLFKSCNMKLIEEIRFE